MQRRRFIKNFVAAVGSSWMLPMGVQGAGPSQAANDFLDPGQAKLMQEKIADFNRDFSDDIMLPAEKMAVLRTLVDKLGQVQSLIGHGRFNILSFDDLLKFSANSAQIGAMTQDELAFVEATFFFEAKKYGFYGEKVTKNLTMKIVEADTIKVKGSGHFVFKGASYELYQKLIGDIGGDIVLTSGIRSLVKQMQLYLQKTLVCNGNLSRASRSLAPPGYSFHGIGDFDVGKNGWGYRNFTDQFAQSDVFKKLTDLGYIDIRYTKTNSFGVRFEPWHIKVC